ncbi:N(5)-(carboxyethyl)ornithine synthase [Tractidigestivibacter sp.]|uniref:N(5)-(carboxyethyl)ornithine synthase n=1 Tax=Tractidigestivibacter sp. TaxID=2847320 RepID=UPI002A91E309|nr:N(5)-(carboxyethyl)ornithine synthase [Tractidigestivibacter sp.]MDY5271490.1 N(5)-(carboxyethyl)ornithine synthase [Tractidigestivibacter sp.]
MNTVGFPMSDKENEKRRALLPEHASLIKHPEALLFERGYGGVLGIGDDEFVSAGARVGSKEEALAQDIICDPKVGDAGYLPQLEKGKTVFGWVHATENRDITNTLIDRGMTAYAWENMYDGERHVFWRNNELAGEAAIMHAFLCYGSMPYETKVAVIGRGNAARGAIKILNMLGAKVYQYSRKAEKRLRSEIDNYDIVVNCVLWDVSRKDHIVSREDLSKMKKGAMIIDVSCDRGGGIETSVPTTIEHPTYVVDGIVHYAVDHTPALFYRTFSKSNSKLIYPYVDQLVEGEIGSVLLNAKVMEHGRIIDRRISEVQGR